MRRPKNVVSYVYRTGSVGKRLGFTLIETVVAIPISLIILLGVGATFSYTISQFYNLLQQNQAQTSLLWASYYTQAYFSQAINVRFIANQNMMDTWMTDIKSSNGLEPTIVGRIDKSFNSSLITDDNKLSTIAVFYREDGDFQAGYASSDLVGTAVWFKNPSIISGVRVDHPPYGGVLYFSSGLGNGTSKLAPRMDTIWYDRLSLFEIVAVECFKDPIGDLDHSICDGGDPDETISYLSGADIVKSITFRIRARYFKTTDKSKWIWCTNSSLTQCIPEVPFRDVERIVKVGFRNNILVKSGDSFTGSNYDERLHGGLYFFKMSLPRLGF